MTCDKTLGSRRHDWKKTRMMYSTEQQRMEQRELSNSPSVSGLETKRTNSRNIPHLTPVAESEAKLQLYFSVEHMIITHEFAFVIEVTILSRDSLVVVTNHEPSSGSLKYSLNTFCSRPEPNHMLNRLAASISQQKM